jgi:conjugative transfer signal peptidase TraF
MLWRFPTNLRYQSLMERKTMTAGRLASVRRIVLVAIAIAAFTFETCSLLGIRINTSTSLPLGLYVATSTEESSLIEFCPPEPFASLAILRGYRDGGSCADGGAPLLKPIVARPGDIVDLSERGIAVNGSLLPNTVPLNRDTKGRPIQHWPFGRYSVAEGTVWAASSYNARSFDSRYFGPIDLSAVRGHLRPLVTQW